jgi:Fe2+ or Zn2+ uptake regulation protein
VLLRVLSGRWATHGRRYGAARAEGADRVATVYRNLQELVREGLIGTLEVAGAAVQFEVNPDDHHHFVCHKCGHVWDVYLSSLNVRINRRRTELDGFQVDRRDVQLHGVCAGCRSPSAARGGGTRDEGLNSFRITFRIS